MIVMLTREEELQVLVDQANAEGRDLGAESKEVMDEIEEEQRQDRLKSLSVKERLRRRLLSGYIDIPFEDGDGTFNVRMNLPSPAQRRQMIRYQMDAEKAIDEGNEEALTELDRQMCVLLGELCMDFDADYIQAGEGFGVDIIGKLMAVIVGTRPVNMEDYQFFRSLPSGT